MESTGASGPVVRIFGGVGVYGVDGPVSIGGPRQRRLLALLAIRPDSVVSIDWLAENLWDDEDRPKETAPALRTYVSRLRTALPEVAQEWIETEAAGYRFTAPAEAVEHRQFGLLREQARRARDLEDPQTSNVLLDEALALFRGDPFRELEDLDWARADIERLHLDRLEMHEERWESALALGRHTQIIGELAAFTTEHGLRERAARQYALALHRSGRTTEALRVIDDHRRTLADQSGLEPSSDITDLEQALLTGDPSLDVEKVGRPLRGYRLLEEIGTGAFSVVWRGMQPSVDREVAIKQIRSELASQPDFIRKFEAEAHLVARIEHPHIVPLIDFWRDPDSAYLVMRWLRGGTLERRLDDGPLSVPETLQVARQIGDALSAAHQQNIVHRDVKAGNILFDEADNAFLTDFGIALEVAESGGPEAALSPGSPAYSSPEQIRRERLGPEADVFSLGVVIFECLTGSLPFGDSTSLEQLVDRQLHMPYPTLASLRPDVPASLSEAVAKATSKDPADRFASVDAFIAALGSDVETSAPQAMVADDTPNPYKGLRAFDDGDADQFFGRESLVNELVSRLSGNTIRSRGLVVVGPSGSGKSSVVRAGLTPALRGGAVPGSSDWFVTTMVPGTDPFESLEAALLRIAVNPPASLLSQLRDGKRGILRAVRRCLDSDEGRALLVIDQFEEIFTGASAEDADAFLSALAVAVEDPTSPLRLVITLRADYYDRPLEHPAFARIVKETAVDVTPLAGDELERAIVEPARQLGVSFEAGLVARIAAETVAQPSPLPLLQHTLRELFDRRDSNTLTVAAYDEIGGLSGALAARAENLYAQADGSQQAAIRRIFGRMTNPGEESADLRRRVSISDLGDDPVNDWFLDQFGKARLITFDRDVTSREPTVEVAHEALLREWPRLVTWLAEDLDVLRSADAIAAAATVWDDGDREPTDLYRGGRLENAIDLALTAPDRLRAIDKEYIEASRASAEAERGKEQRRVRRLRRLVSGTALALVIALIAGAIAVREQNRASDKVVEADLATLISRSAALSSENPEVSILLALEAHRRDPKPETEQAILNALGSTTIPNRVASVPLLIPDLACNGSIGSSDGTVEWSIVGGMLVSKDSLTGEISEHGLAPTSCGWWMGDESADRRVFWTDDSVGPSDGASFAVSRIWLGPYDGPWELEKEYEVPLSDVGLKSSFRPTHRLIAGIFSPQSAQVVLLDDRTGEFVGAPISGGWDFLSVDANLDGTLYAVGFGTPNRPEGDGRTVIVNMVTGEEIFRVNTVVPFQNLGFDPRGGELVGVTFDGMIMTIDLDAQEIVSTVDTGLAGSIKVYVRDDGLLVVVSEGQIQLADRRAGFVDDPIELRNAIGSRFRPDGRVLVFTADGRDETIDLEGSALVEKRWEVDSFAGVAFNDGLAGAYEFPAGTPEVIDLDTGARTSTDLIDRTGEPFTPVKIYPEVDGIIALDLNNVVGRWEGDRMVEELALDGEPQTGTRYLDLWAVISFLPDEANNTITRRGTGWSGVVDLLNVAEGELGVIFSIDADLVSTVHPTRDGGVHVIDLDGRLHTYDSEGNLIGELETGIEQVGIITMDPTTGILAIAAPVQSIDLPSLAIVDPDRGLVDQLPGSASIVNLGFASDGELLAITGSDGTVRLWDVARRATAGLVWDGSGAIIGSPSWYDETTESIWVNSSGELLQIPVNPERWIERACELVGRDLTPDEWDRYVPGEGEVLSACG